MPPRTRPDPALPATDAPRGRAVRLGLAAVAIVALLVTGALLSRDSLNEDLAREETGERVRLLQPGPGAVAETTTLLAWQPVSGASAYEVEVFTSEGRRVLTGVTVDTTLPLARGLVPGDYRWGVTAFLAGADSVRGALRMLRVAPRR